MNFKILSILSIMALFSFRCKGQQDSVKKDIDIPKIKYQLWQSMTEFGWQNSRKIDFIYNKALLIQEVTSKIKEGLSTFDGRTNHSYDENSNKIKTKRELWRNGRWKFGMHVSYDYREGKIIQRKDSLSIGNSSRLSIIDYIYNGDVLLEEVSQIVNENQKTKQSKIIYHYNKKGLVIKKEFPVWSDDTWQKSRKMTLDYNDLGHHIRTTRYNWKDNIWTENINYELEVGTKGNRLNEIWQRLDEKGKRKDFTKVVYIY